MSKDKDNKGGQHLQPVAPGKGQMAVYDPMVNAGIDDDDTIDLREYWRILLKRRWTVAAVITIVVVAAALATLLMIPEYRATAQLQISPQQGRVLAFDNLGEEFGGRSFQEFMGTQVQVIRSRSLVEAVVRREQLHTHPELAGEIRQRSVLSELRSLARSVSGSISGNGPMIVGDEQAIAAATSRLRDRISVEPVRNSFLINVSVTSFDPELAERAVNALVQEYVRTSMQRRVDAGSEARDFLETQLVDMRINLERADEALMDFARQNNIADLDERLSMARTALRRLSDRQNEIQTELVQIRTWRDLIEQGRGESLDPVLNSSVIADLERRLLEANTEYTRLSATFQDEFPRVQEVLGRIARLEQELADRRRIVIDNILSRYDILSAQEASLESAIIDREASILALNERAVQFNILRREFQTSEELYDGLLQRMKEVGVAAGVQENNIAVIEPGRRPGSPFSPNLPRNLALALALGLMGGVGLALLLEFLDSTIRRIEDIERLVDRPVLGMVPLVKFKDKDKDRERRSKVVEDPERSVSFHSQIKPSSSVSESFRSLRTSLGFSTAEGMPRSIMVTSTSVGEGKTTTAINLATVLAQNGHRVLLIDGDLRKSRIHREFNQARTPGLTNRIALFDNNGQDQSAIYGTFIDNLFVMPAGTTTPSPAEMLSSDRLQKIIEGCKRAFDYVILDSAPVLGLADALILSRRVDGVLFVTKAAVTGKESFRMSMRCLAQVQAPVLGVVLNGVDLDSPEYSYYSSYYYNYEGEDDDSADETPKLRQAGA